MPNSRHGLFLAMLSAAAALGALSAATLAQEAAPGEDPIHKQLRALRDNMFQAYEKREVDKLLSYLEPSAVVTWQNGDRTVGPDELKAFYDRMMTGDSRIVTDVKSKLVDDGLSTLYGGDTAVAKGTLEDTFVLASGNSFVLNSKWTATVVKSGEDWKVASFHASSSIFDNPILSAAQQWTLTLVMVSAVVGLLVGAGGMALLRRKARPRERLMPSPSTDRRHWNAAPEDRALLASARLDEPPASPAELRATIREAMASRGIEYATALLYNALCDSARHGAFVEAFHRQAEELTSDVHSLPRRVCIVPGAFYQQYAWTNEAGESLCREFEKLGVSWETIPTNGVGTLEQNARTVRGYLARQGDDPLALVSLSKGGCEVKVALRDDPLANVACWFNVSGILRGSLLVDWIEARPALSWINGLFMRGMGRDYCFYSGMGRQAGGELDFPLRTPPEMLVVHVSGFPLLRHTNFRLATTWYRRFQSLGPNDSAMLLEDLLDLPGYVLPAWGIDHYWRAPGATRLLARGIVGCWQQRARTAQTRTVQINTAPAETAGNR